MAAKIHKTAYVHKKAVVEDGVTIGPFCSIEKGCRIRKGTRLMSNVIVEGNTEIGQECTIYPFVTIGLPPQDIKYKNEETGVRIGSGNCIREYTSIHRASVGGDGLTEIGNRNFIMSYVHVAHDCKIGNSVIMANLATLAGHVHVEDFAVIGGIVAVHQFTRIGAYAMVGGFSGIGQDIPPYTVASGPRAKLYGLNTIGLKRHGFTEQKVAILKKAYKILFRDKLTLRDALKKIESDLPPTDEVTRLVEFIEKNKRGICR